MGRRSAPDRERTRIFPTTVALDVSANSRAVSSVIATLLLIAVVVVLSATIATALLGAGSELRDPAPNVAQSSGEFVEQEGFTGGMVRITHLAGDTVAVADLEIAIDATDACSERERLVNLPEDDSNNAGRFADTNVESGDIGDSIVSGGYTELGVLDSRTTNEFTAGSWLQFRLAGSSGYCPLDPGDRVVVRVVHVPSNSVLITEDLTA